MPSSVSKTAVVIKKDEDARIRKRVLSSTSNPIEEISRDQNTYSSKDVFQIENKNYLSPTDQDEEGRIADHSNWKAQLRLAINFNFISRYMDFNP